MIEIREYKEGDYESIVQCKEGVGFMDMKDVLPSSILATLTDNKIPIVVGGITLLDRPTAWARVQDGIKLKHTVVRIIKESIRIIAKESGIDEYVSYIKDGFIQGDRLASAIGMKETEEKQEYYGNTYKVYSWQG